MSGNGPARFDKRSMPLVPATQPLHHFSLVATIAQGAQSKALYNLNNSGRENDHERRAPVRVLLSSVNGPIEESGLGLNLNKRKYATMWPQVFGVWLGSTQRP